MTTVTGPAASGRTHHRRGPAGRLLLDASGRPRSGWRLTGYLIVVLAAMGAASIVAGGPLAANVAAHGAVALVVVAVTYGFRRGVDRRPWGPIGLWPPRWRQAAAGLAAGAGSTLAVFAVTWALGWARITGTELAERAPAAMATLLAAGLFMYATSAVIQEVAFRGYAVQTLADGWPLRRAAAVSSVIFAVLHCPGVPSPQFALVLIVDVTLMAGFFVLTRLCTGALWLAIGFHTAFNWVMDDLLSLDTDAGADYGDALVHVRLHAPGFGLGPGGGVELVYLANSAALFAGYWLLTRRLRTRTRGDR